MDSTGQLTQPVVKRKKSHWALPIFLAEVVLGFYFLVANAFRDYSNNVKQSHVSILLIVLIVLLGLSSVSLYRKSNRGGKFYGIFDLFVTLLIPFFVLFVALK